VRTIRNRLGLAAISKSIAGAAYIGGLALASAVGLTMPSPAATAAASSPVCSARAERVAELPTGTFLENLLVEADGSVLFTDYTGRAVYRYRPGRGVQRFASLPAHPVSMAQRNGKLWVAAHGSSFMEGPAVTS
jgi:streptogramin lyase